MCFGYVLTLFRSKCSIVAGLLLLSVIGRCYLFLSALVCIFSFRVHWFLASADFERKSTVHLLFSKLTLQVWNDLQINTAQKVPVPVTKVFFWFISDYNGCQN